MKKILFITIFQILLLQFGHSQNQFVAKMIVPENSARSLVKMKIDTNPAPAIVYPSEPAGSAALLFNDQPVLKLNKNVKRPVLFFIELSCSDLLENSMNSFKADLVNTYDDHITELFKDAPSLFKMTCIISF